MPTVLALMAKQRGSVQFVHQSLYYPMTDANAQNSESLRKFKDGPYGSAEGLSWFWNSYLTAEESRSGILVSPLQATLADLQGLPTCPRHRGRERRPARPRRGLRRQTA